MSRSRATWQIDAAGAAIVAILAGAVYLLGYRPAADGRAALARVQERLGEEQRRDDTNAGSLQTARRRVSDLQEKISREGVKLLPPSEVNATLSALAKENGLRVLEIVPDDPRTGVRFTTVPVTMKATGSYAQCASLLSALKAQSPDTGVGSMALTADRSNAGAQLTLDLLWRATPPKPAAKTASADQNDAGQSPAGQSP